MSVTCDYLVMGAGAEGLAFTDTLLDQTPGLKVIIVDKRSAPGGMWNDTYQFAKLDQPSIYFGISASVQMEGSRPKCGEVSKRATKSEVLMHFRKCMTHLVMNRSVRYMPNYSAEVLTVGHPETQVRITSTLIANKTIDIAVRKKVVHTAFGTVPAPLTSRLFPYDADAGVKIVRPHELTYSSGMAAKPMYVVIGAGKTGLDTVLWLLSRNVPHEKVRWVRPRDSWYFVAEEMEQETYSETCTVFNSCVATAENTEDVYFKLENEGKLCRIDEQRFPEVFHCLMLSKPDLASVRQLHAIRMGHVHRVAADRLHLANGSVPVEEGTLFIDCTGNGRNRMQKVAPVFSSNQIRLQRVAEYSAGAGEMSAPFCASVVGMLEATYPGSPHTKNNLCTPAPFPDHYYDWIKYHLARKEKHEAMHDDRRLSTFLLTLPSSRFHRMTAQRMRKVIANLHEYPYALDNIRRIAPRINYSRLLKTTDTLAYDKPTSKDEAATEAGTAIEVDAIKEQLAFLLAEHEKLRKRMFTVQAENDELKQSVVVAEARQQKAETYVNFFEGDEHPAHRVQQLKKDMQTIQHGSFQSTLKRNQSDICFAAVHAEDTM